jgi:hypothetical protein
VQLGKKLGQVLVNAVIVHQVQFRPRELYLLSLTNQME